MKVLVNENDLFKLINKEKIFIILIGSDSCMPCKAIGNKIDEFTSLEHINSIYVPIECYKEMAASLNIYSVPSVLVYVNGKLTVSESGYFSLDKIFNNIRRIKEIMEG